MTRITVSLLAGFALTTAPPLHAQGVNDQVTLRNSPPNSVHSLAFSVDGKTLAQATGDDKVVVLWDVATGKPSATIAGHTNVSRIVAYSPDGTTLASGSFDGSVRLYDAMNKLTGTLKVPAVGVWTLSWSHDGKTIAIGTSGPIILFYDVATAKLTDSFKGHIRLHPAYGLQP